MTGLDWEKAKQRDQQRNATKERKRLNGEQRRQQKYGERGAAIARFALQHGIGCFVCTDRKPRQWAKSGINARGPWAICTDCVALPRSLKQTSGK